MAQLKTVEQLISQGDSKLSGTVTLKTVPKSSVKIEDDILELDVNFPITRSNIDFPNVNVFVICFIYKDGNGGVTNEVAHARVVDNKVRFGMPYNYQSSLLSVMLGYSAGQLGGYTKSSYHDRTKRSFYFFDSSVFDTNIYDYTVYGDKSFSKKTIVVYNGNQVENLKYGRGAKYGDGHIYGGSM